MTKSVLICDSEPVAVEGIRAVLAGTPDFRCVAATNTLAKAEQWIAERRPDVVIVDRAFGANAVQHWIQKVAAESPRTAILVWAPNLNEAEALRLVQNGAHGAISKNASLSQLFVCLRAIASGERWIDESEDTAKPPSTNKLSAREQQVAALVERGMRDKEIAQHLGIKPGTVKIHLRHIYEKTGIHCRYGLAITSLREKGLLAMPTI